MTDDVSKLKIVKEKQDGNRKKRGALLKAAAVGGVLLLGALLYFSGLLTPAMQVEAGLVSQVYPSQAITLLNASGYVVAQRKAAVASKLTGRLVELLVEEGLTVKKGEILARLENDDSLAAREQAAANLQAAVEELAQAKAELQDATLALKRSRELSEKGYVSRQETDSAEARFKRAVAASAGAEAGIKAARAALKGADISVEYALIRSPFDAVVLTKNADVGDILTPLGSAANARASVVTLADMGSLQVEVDVSESNLSQVKKGQHCEIRLDAFPDRRFRGRVHMIVPTADRAKATVLVKVAFAEKNDDILPEMSAKVAFLERPLTDDEERPRTGVSTLAVADRKGSKVVYLVSGERVVETQVTLGAAIGDRGGKTGVEMVEVLSGVKAGDRVVLGPPVKMKDGSRIKVVEK